MNYYYFLIGIGICQVALAGWGLATVIDSTNRNNLKAFLYLILLIFNFSVGVLSIFQGVNI